ncbi:MAG: universal stress protein, partial [Hymenobacteraceae bacterium]|nr:universal stress protein [Hymenobacteraceae bacterium]MDX5395055.1 universal stress protein [Hymenobacteraceae bacterium]MDX5511091.1 universal stress protein [Hymenobacteraceae bacterium]
LANKLNTELFVVHLLDDHHFKAMVPDDTQKNFRLEKKVVAMEKLQAKCRETYAEAGIRPKETPYHCQVLDLPFERNVLEFAESEKADLIIAGLRGANFLERLLIGSHTENLIDYSDIPVLAVTSDFMLPEITTGLTAISVKHPPTKNQWHTLANLNEKLQLTLKAITLYQTEESAEKAETEFIKCLHDNPHSGLITDFIAIPATDVPEALIRIVSTEKQLLILFRRERSTFESLFKSKLSTELAAKAGLSFLAIP